MNQPKITSAGNEELQKLRDVFNKYGLNYSQIVGEENTVVSCSLYVFNQALKEVSDLIAASNQQLLRELRVQAVIFSHVTHDFDTELEVGEEQAVPLSVIEAKLKEYGEK